MARSTPANTTGARAGRAVAHLFRALKNSASAAGGGTAAGSVGGPSTRNAGGDVQRALAHGGKHLVRRWGGAARRLGLQVTGVLYLVFALGFGSSGYQSWTHDRRGLGPHPASLTQMSAMTAVELGLALLFVYFGLSSFARAGRRP